MSDSFSCRLLPLRWCSCPPATAGFTTYLCECAAGLGARLWSAVEGFREGIVGFTEGVDPPFTGVEVAPIRFACSVASTGALGRSSLLENILVNLSLMDDFSTCFGPPSEGMLPLVGWPFCGFKLGDLVGSSTDFKDDCFDAFGEVVLSEAVDISGDECRDVVKDPDGEGRCTIVSRSITRRAADPRYQDEGSVRQPQVFLVGLFLDGGDEGRSRGMNGRWRPRSPVG